PHSADGTLSLDLGRQNPDPSARRHGAHGTHANQNHRPRYPYKPAVPSESGQVAQNLALNPHRPTLPQAHTPPAVSSFEAFRTPASAQPLAQRLAGIRKPLTKAAVRRVESNRRSRTHFGHSSFAGPCRGRHS